MATETSSWWYGVVDRTSTLQPGYITLVVSYFILNEPCVLHVLPICYCRRKWAGCKSNGVQVGKKKRKERKLSKEKKKETRTVLLLVKWINNFFPSLCVFFFFFFTSENVGTQNKISTFVDSWDSFPLRYTGRIVFIMHRQTVTYYFPILLLLWNLHFLILFPSLLRYVLLRRVGRLSVFLFFKFSFPKNF